MNFKSAFAQPFKGDKKTAVQNAIAGSLINAAPLLLMLVVHPQAIRSAGGIISRCVDLLFVGYAIAFMRIRQQTAAASNQMPAWSEWKRMLKDGFKVTLVTWMWQLLIFGSSMAIGYYAVWRGLDNGPVMGGTNNLISYLNIAKCMLSGGPLNWLIMAFIATLVVWGFTFVPLMKAHFARIGTFKSMIQVTFVTRMLTKNPKQTLKVVAASYVASGLAWLLSLTIIGAPFAIYWRMCAKAALWSDFYQSASGNQSLPTNNGLSISKSQSEVFHI